MAGPVQDNPYRLSLRSVYETPHAHDILYRLLKERRPDESISHKRMPTWEEHCRFVDSQPYQFWYIVSAHDPLEGFTEWTKDANPVGAIYLTERLAEIGCWIFDEFENSGLRAQAILALMRKHPRPRYVANINPRNADLTAVFSELGFKHIQNTYELEPGK